MHVLNGLAALAAVAAALASTSPANAEGRAPRTLTVNGKCDAGSQIAEGPRDADIRGRESRLFCDVAVVSYGPGQALMVQFANSQAHHSPIVGYAGVMEDAQILDVERVYLEPGHASPVDEGNCKFAWKAGRIDYIACGAPVYEGSRRTVPVVVFIASPP